LSQVAKRKKKESKQEKGVWRRKKETKPQKEGKVEKTTW
jgi:hypothetical protein